MIVTGKELTGVDVGRFVRPDGGLSGVLLVLSFADGLERSAQITVSVAEKIANDILESVRLVRCGAAVPSQEPRRRSAKASTYLSLVKTDVE